MTIKTIDAYSPLFKRDSKGKVRIWFMEIGANSDQTVWAHRAVAGLNDGERVENAWKHVSQKNVGKANETSLKQQAEQEIVSLYDKKKTTGYSEAISEVDAHEYFKPMLAETYGKKGLTGNISQPKFDGMRSIVKADGTWSRSGKPILSVPHIWNKVSSFFETYPEAVIDGELYNHSYRDKFEDLMSILRKEDLSEEDLKRNADIVKLYFYDGYLNNEGKQKPFLERYDELAQAIFDHFGEENGIDPLLYVGCSECEYDEELDAAYEKYVEEGYEGQIVRTNNCPYEHKRSKSVLKRKEFQTAEFRVKSVLEGQGNWAGFAKHMELYLPVQTDTEEGIFKTGMRGSQETLKKMLEDAKLGVTPKWATIRFFGVTAYGVPRFPVAIDWGYNEERDD